MELPQGFEHARQALYFGPLLLFNSSCTGSIYSCAPSNLTAFPALIPPASLLNVTTYTHPSPLSLNSSPFLEHSVFWLASWLLLSAQSYQGSLFIPMHLPLTVSSSSHAPCTLSPLPTTPSELCILFCFLFPCHIYTPCHIYGSFIRALMSRFFLCS